MVQFVYGKKPDYFYVEVLGIAICKKFKQDFSLILEYNSLNNK